MKTETPNAQVLELLQQSLAHEEGGVKVYETAVKCAINDDLREEWSRYLTETRRHVEVLTFVFSELGISKQQTPGVEVIEHMGASLVRAMEMAKSGGKPDAAQLVACECVVLAETKDHLNWELLGKCSEKLLKGAAAQALKEACEEVEDQEDEHLYHTKGWCRELWIQSLGMHAILPPPEEEKDVKTAIGAARAEQSAEADR